MTTGYARHAVWLLLLVPAVVACATQPSALTTPSAAPSAAAPSTAPASSFGATPSGLGPDVDPCRLVTRSDAEQLAGTQLNPAVEIKGESPSCTYSGPVTGPLAQVEVYVGDGAKKILDIDRQLHHTLTAVPGTGDEAFEEDGAIFLRKSDLWVAIRLVRLQDPKLSREPLELLARTVASRL
jgi:Protein of unknown function (DUF3558)